MRYSLTTSIDKYLKNCQQTDWIKKEAYKFEFSNFVYNNINWETQSNENIYKILKQSLKLIYTDNSRGIQFIIKSANDLKEPITINDIINFRKVYEGNDIKAIDWNNRGMSFTGLSSWLATLFPDKLYPVPMKGFDKTILYLFGTKKKIPKTGKNYILNCQVYLKETEKILKQYPIQELYLDKWNKYYSDLPELGINKKTNLSKSDWIWLVQDFHLFVLRYVLKLDKRKKKKTKIKIAETFEGKGKLALHLKYERDTTFIKKIKEKALKENQLLNCEICGFSFLETYGKVGEGFIEAHHIYPLSEREKKNKVTKKDDIILVCSNCHRMLHRKINGKLLEIKELKNIIKNNAQHFV